MSTPSIEDVLAAHFIMWHDFDDTGRPKGEWVCQCGAKFGFSDSAIAHVADAIRAHLAEHTDEAAGAAERAFKLADAWESKPYECEWGCESEMAAELRAALVGGAAGASEEADE